MVLVPVIAFQQHQQLEEDWQTHLCCNQTVPSGSTAHDSTMVKYIAYGNILSDGLIASLCN